MSLIEYHKKRHFQKTTEPSGKVKKSSPKLQFVIHKHNASHLHYDLRLEMNGVLKSWAVPKGPSLNSQDKRLAMMVEDHPFDYKDFEGIIPAGNYGAGQVIIWDEGYYQPSELTGQEVNKQLLAELYKGHISFILKGKKLKGEFSLIKMRNSKKGNEWLLIKKNDKYAKEDDILAKNKSVRSKKTIENLEKTETQKLTLPKNIQPMLATLITEPFNNKDWLFEIKWDGFRIIAYVNGSDVNLLSRNQKNYTGIFSAVSKELATMNVNVVFDGEMVVVDETGRSHFQLLQQYQKSGNGQLKYYIFDILWYDGKSLVNLPLLERKKILKKILKNNNFNQISEFIESAGVDFFKSAANLGLEGVMAKKMDSTYQPGVRSDNWLKIKSTQRQEVVIGGYTAPRGSRKGIGALVLGVYDEDHQLIYVGHSGSGLTVDSIKDLKAKLDRLAQDQSPFAEPPKTNMPVTWVKPKLVCEIAFNEWTDDNHMRQPIFIGLRDDKKPTSVVRENPIINPTKSSAEEQIITVNNHPLKLTNLQKVFWPDDGYTKNDLINYYRKVAQFILPYLKDRPESLLRHPNGIDGFKFFQKNMESEPAWAKIFPMYSESEGNTVRYLVCQNEATLLYMVNLGCIEINPWLSRIKYPEKPDFCVLDLDPEAIGFDVVIKVAQHIYKYLTKLNVECYCKTSGATGLHICIPLGAKYTYDQSKEFAELIVTEVNQQLPDITSIVRSPRLRQGKVYLDFLQNRRGQTITAPYAVRPRPGATVSTPLEWEEVKGRLTPQQFTIETVHKRLQKIGDIWKPVLGKGIKLESVLKKLL